MGRRMPLDASPVATPPHAGVAQGLNLFNKPLPAPPDGGGEPRGRHEAQSSSAQAFCLDQPLASVLPPQANPKLMRRSKVYAESWRRVHLMGRMVPLDVSPVATPPNAGVARGLNLFNQASLLQMEAESHGAAMKHTEFIGPGVLPRPAPGLRPPQQVCMSCALFPATV
ncbi:uncharacterized protein LOC144167260 [Haemaphysalis longicornis]